VSREREDHHLADVGVVGDQDVVEHDAGRRR
jgi:hypothetical protein